MKANSSTESNHGHPVFVTTQWTRVLEARGDSPEARAALGELCEAYYKPVFAFIQRSAPDEEAAKDLTQEFFARLLARQGIERVDPQRGRFRSFLLGAVKHFLCDMHDHAHRLKRGGGEIVESIQAGSDSSPDLQVADTAVPSPDREFDRKWALTLLERALGNLAKEHLKMGKERQFQILKPWLTGDAAQLSLAAAALELEMSEGTLKVAIHRLRRRFREILKREIRQTVSQGADVNEELRFLLEALI